MNKYVLDASAMLALINKECGYEVVSDVVTTSVMSTVNIAESFTSLQKHGLDIQTARVIITDLLFEVVPFDESQAFIAAQLHKSTSQFGLSLGDRACLSVALHLKIPVLTADKLWSKLKLDIPIQIIR